MLLLAQLIAAGSLIFSFLVVLTWVAIPFTLLAIAEEKGRSQAWAFLLGIVLPIPAILYYLAVPSLKPVRIAAEPVARPEPDALTNREMLAAYQG